MLTNAHSKRTIGAIAIGALVAVSVFSAVNLAWWREQIIADGERRASNLAIVLTEYLRGTFAAADAALAELAIHSRRVGGPGAPEDEWAPVLQSTRAALPGIGSLSVVDAQGVIRYSTQPRIVGQSRSDEYVFKRLSTTEHDELVIDTPFLSVVGPPTYLIPVGRRMTNAAGRFSGIVVATFTPAVVSRVFRSADVGPHGVITVLHPSGVVIFREPANAAPPTADAHITVARETPTPPLAVSVSLARVDVLAEWRREAELTVVFFGIATVFVAAGLVIMFRQIDRADAEEAARRAQLQQEQELRRQLEKANSVKDEFLMSVSHELRTPLTSISGWSQLLTTGRLNETQARAAIGAIHRGVDVQSRLIEDLLDVSRLLGGRLRLDRRVVDVNEIVAAAIENVQPAAENKHIAVHVEVGPGPVWINADRDRVLQMVWNMLSNAVKFTPDGGEVRASVALRDGFAEIAVADNGIGIAADFLPHVFERFRQGDGGPSRRHGGLGLGLAIVRQLAELHGGTVDVESAGAGAGATFRIRLPAHAARGDAPAAPVDAAATDAGARR